MRVRYYLIGSMEGAEGTLARVHDHEHYYLDKTSGKWIAHETVFDRVTFEAASKRITKAEAQAWVAENAPGSNPVWV